MNMGYVAIDSLDQLHSEEIKEMREALESQIVKVRRMVSGKAPARTRITASINVGKERDKAMNTYLYPCQSLKDTYIFQSPPDITRWDIFIPFADEDVPKEKIVGRRAKERPIPKEVFKRHVYWVWSRRPDQIHYTKEAEEEIIEESKKTSERILHLTPPNSS